MGQFTIGFVLVSSDIRFTGDVANLIIVHLCYQRFVTPINIGVGVSLKEFFLDGAGRRIQTVLRLPVLLSMRFSTLLAAS